MNTPWEIKSGAGRYNAYQKGPVAENIFNQDNLKTVDPMMAFSIYNHKDH